MNYGPHNLEGCARNDGKNARLKRSTVAALGELLHLKVNKHSNPTPTFSETSSTARQQAHDERGLEGQVQQRVQDLQELRAAPHELALRRQSEAVRPFSAAFELRACRSRRPRHPLMAAIPSWRQPSPHSLSTNAPAPRTV